MMIVSDLQRESGLKNAGEFFVCVFVFINFVNPKIVLTVAQVGAKVLHVCSQIVPYLQTACLSLA